MLFISKVKSAQYFGVTITHNHSWKEHIAKITSKANSTRGILQRNLRQCSTNVKSLAYTYHISEANTRVSFTCLVSTNSITKEYFRNGPMKSSLFYLFF